MHKKLTLVNTFAIGLMIVLNFLFCDSAKAQIHTILYYQNFDSTFDHPLPPGWTATSTDSVGWYVDTTGSSSDTLTFGSKNNNLVVKNLYGNAVDTVFTNGISTIGYDSIKVLWSCRNSTHFADSGSTVQFAWTKNGGTTWDTVAFIQNANSSAWTWIQDSIWINLPVAASQQLTIKFCWIGRIHNEASGTYRIDDFTVSGISYAGINEVNDTKPMPIVFMQSNNLLNIRMNNFSTGKVEVKVANIDGSLVYNSMIAPVDQTINLNSLASGVYIVSMIGAEGTFNHKLIVNH